MNSLLCSRIKVKDKLYHEFLHKRNPALFLKFKKHRNSLTSGLEKAKEEYFHSKSDSLGENPRKIWDVINTLTGRKSCSNITEISFDEKDVRAGAFANAVNVHFIQVCSNACTAMNIPDQSVSAVPPLR